MKVNYNDVENFLNKTLLIVKYELLIKIKFMSSLKLSEEVYYRRVSDSVRVFLKNLVESEDLFHFSSILVNLLIIFQ